MCSSQTAHDAFNGSSIQGLLSSLSMGCTKSLRNAEKARNKRPFGRFVIVIDAALIRLSAAISVLSQQVVQ